MGSLGCDPSEEKGCTVYTNVASRMLQKEALHYAQVKKQPIHTFIIPFHTAISNPSHLYSYYKQPLLTPLVSLHYAQTAGLICIIIVQWADLMICKTRWLSIRQQVNKQHNTYFNTFIMPFNIYKQPLLTPCLYL